ncbi:MAG: lytic transglycosylase [Alcanivorax sp.]|nr:LysM peptidoglycan-binding domain-containing protein [Alcanivorax sp. ZXX171]MBU59241.1 lytic transglycosylase [Alcanivorax sp.]
MNKLLGCVALGLTLLGSGCALAPSGPASSDQSSSRQVDELPPMPAAEPSLEDPELANGMAEPEPRNPDHAGQPDRDLWQRIRAGYGLDLNVDNDRVRAQREWYARHPSYFTRVTTRSERYLHFIVEEAEARDMPLELVMLPVVESAFDPFAYSHGRAAGPWQFIPSTGKYFGLDQTWWYDGRRDIKRSTRAALDYLQKLSARFDGDWLLALAAYNAGGGTVSRARRHNKEAGEPLDFWHLNLPRETTAYVPKLLAVAQIVREPERYGVTLHPIDDEPYFASVDVGGQIDLAQAASLAGISTEELYLLNPAFNRWATAPDGPTDLLVPVGQADDFRERLAALPAEQRMRWLRYTIQRGDSLGLIAKRHRTTAAVLRDINDLHGNTIIAGRTLLIPEPAADQYALSADARLAKQQGRERDGRQRVDHRVAAGDTLWELARSYDVSVRALARWNNMAPGDPLRVGQTLAVWTENDPAAPAGADRQEMIRKVRYSVRRGDSLYAIADRFNVSVSQIRDWNNGVQGNRYLQPGDRLTLYVDVRSAP